jgi:hypothetical protein
MRWWPKLIVLQAFTLMLMGCALPATDVPSGLPSSFTDVSIKSLEPGTTTREDVIHRFGIPHFTVEVEQDIPGLPGSPPPAWSSKPREPLLYGSHRNEQDRIYGYKWYPKHESVLVLPISKAGYVTADNYLCIEFTPDNRLKRFKHITEPFFSRGNADKEVTQLLVEWVRQK